MSVPDREEKETGEAREQGYEIKALINKARSGKSPVELLPVKGKAMPLID